MPEREAITGRRGAIARVCDRALTRTEQRLPIRLAAPSVRRARRTVHLRVAGSLGGARLTRRRSSVVPDDRTDGADAFGFTRGDGCMPALADIATFDVVTVSADEPLPRVMSLMLAHDIRHILIVRDGRCIGMVSDRDVMRATGWSRESTNATGESTAVTGADIAASVMSAPVITLDPDARLHDACRLMLEHRVSAIPLVGGGRLVGIVTRTDLLRLCVSQSSDTSSWRDLSLGSCMQTVVFTLRAGEKLAVAMRIMAQESIRHILVVDGPRIVGMLSDHDVRRALGRIDNCRDIVRLTPDTVSVQTVMSQDVQCADVADTLSDAARRMIDGRFGALPVVRDGRWVGMITETDLLVALAADPADDNS